MKNNSYPFKNPPLPYPYNALEPFIDAKTMELHHDRHLQTYVDNLNKILSDYPKYQTWTLQELIINSKELPKEIRIPVLNNAGGVFNHVFYFNQLSNQSTRDEDKKPAGKLAERINTDFGSFDKFKEEFKKCGMSVFGSGYCWLTMDKSGRLNLTSTHNQDTTLMMGLQPILGIDVWEHAYYLKHYNKRNDYIDDLFNVINWEEADKRYMNGLNIS